MDDKYENDEEKEAVSIDDILMQEERAALEELDTIDDRIRDRTILMDEQVQEVEKKISEISGLLDLAQRHDPYNHERKQRFLSLISDLQRQIQATEVGAFNDVVMLEKLRVLVLEKLRRLKRFRM